MQFRDKIMSADCTFRNTILKEQIDLVRLIKEIEESVTAVKGQINALSVSCMQLYFTIAILHHFIILPR